MYDKLKEVNTQINELPEIRKHVLILLSFINTIKTGIKSVHDKEEYLDSIEYKQEMSSLISQISTFAKGYNIKENLAKSEFGKHLIELASINVNFTDNVMENEFNKGNASTIVKPRRLIELLSEIDSKLRFFSNKNT